MSLEVNLHPIDPERHQLLCKVAWLYYQDDLTQAEIAEKLGLSRVTINRLIKEARERGVVKISVVTEQASEFDLGQQLCSRYQLLDAQVTPPVTSENDLTRSLGQAAAAILMQRIQPGMTVGIGVGRTVSQISEYFHPTAALQCRFIGLTGALDIRMPGICHIFDTVSKLANASQGESVYIPAPSYVTYESVKKALLSEDAVRDAIQIAAQSDIAIFSIGVADYSALLYQFGQITDQDLQELEKNQATGDVIGHFFGVNGLPLKTDLNNRVIGIGFDELMDIPLKILVAGGVNKRKALKVALEHHLCNILVTDMATASALLE